VLFRFCGAARKRRAACMALPADPASPSDHCGASPHAFGAAHHGRRRPTVFCRSRDDRRPARGLLKLRGFSFRKKELRKLAPRR
jgi:hypothetical protein